jgi:hypothetical protein
VDGPAGRTGRASTLWAMRWETLFDDIEAQLAAADRAGVRADVADLVRAERATVQLADRLRASVGLVQRLRVAGGEPVEGELVDVSEQWVLLAQGAERRVLVPMAAIAAVAGVGPYVAPEPGQVERRLGLGHALRVLARDRTAVVVGTGDIELVGRLGAVGADHVEVTVPGAGGAAVPWVVPFAALRWVRSGSAWAGDRARARASATAGAGGW